VELTLAGVAAATSESLSDSSEEEEGVAGCDSEGVGGEGVVSTGATPRHSDGGSCPTRAPRPFLTLALPLAGPARFLEDAFLTAPGIVEWGEVESWEVSGRGD
jgi:hypothetical protein